MNPSIRNGFLAVIAFAVAAPCFAQYSVARQWNEELLDAIRRDRARPTVHARNLFHTSIAMWDGWAAYDPVAQGYLVTEKPVAADVAAARAETISFAAYRLLRFRFAGSPGAATSLPSFDARMDTLGFDRSITSETGDTPAALGNRIAAAVIAFGAADGSNEAGDFLAPDYAPVNPPMVVALAGTVMVDPNRWQPLALDFFIDQSGIVLGAYPPHLTPHWTMVTPFALSDRDRSPATHFDPGTPPLLGGAGSEIYVANVVHLLTLSSQLDPDDGVTIDISPSHRGAAPLGTYDGPGHPLNPYTGEAYAANVVKRGDWGRVLAEFWADGPDSETPPGHWNTIANYVSDRPDVEKRVGGVGPVVDDLEWDVKLYLTLNGTLHDAAVCAWGAKGHYDYGRPISMIRYMAGLGQSSEPGAADYHPLGLPLIPGLIERITFASTAPGERHEHLAFYQGELAVRTWPNAPEDPETQYSGVHWYPALHWVPYQRPTFVTPPFAGYVSGHSTFSRAAAEVLAAFTGSPFFPGGLGQFYAPKNNFLVFEAGPSEDVHLQWATYYDAADESALSRIYGGIHPRQDDIPGRIIGHKVGRRAWLHAQQYIHTDGAIEELLAVLARQCLLELDVQGFADGGLLLSQLGPVFDDTDPAMLTALDTNGNGVLQLAELMEAADGYREVHRADQNMDHRIDLSELLRIIQFFTSGGYHCAANAGATEDGYVPGIGAQDCLPHSADYESEDWRIELGELLRIIQLFNSSEIVPCETEADGFCPAG